MVRRAFESACVSVTALGVAFGVTLAAMAGTEEALKAYDQGDYGAAFEQWRPLAEAGDAEAQYMLGSLYDYGYGLPRDYRKAAYWFEMAAEQGHMDAAHSLAWLYTYGGRAEAGSVRPDAVLAAKWLVPVANSGAGRAQHLLSEMYLTGDGMGADIAEACRWALEAARQGVPEAKFNAGLFLGRGEGCDTDLVEAYGCSPKSRGRGIRGPSRIWQR